MEDRKPFIIAIVILVLLVLGLGGYIGYDIVQEKKAEAKKETKIDDIDIDLNAFYNISDILEKMDKSFNNSHTLYVGYPYSKKRIYAKDFDIDAAVFMSVFPEIKGSNGERQSVPEMKVKSNFSKIFGKYLKYEAKDLNAGDEYKIAYSADGTKYNYRAASIYDTYQPGYIAINKKTSLEDNKVILLRKICYVEYVGSPETSLQAVIYTDHTKQRKVAEMFLTNGDLSKKELISKYGSKLKEFKYTFVQNKDDDYSFFSIEAVK